MIDLGPDPMQYFYSGHQNKDDAKSSASTVDRLAAVVAAVAAVFSVVAQSKDSPELAWSLVGIAILVAILALVRPLIVWLRASLRGRQRNKIVCAQRGELLHFAERFFRLANSNDSSSLQSILFSLCGNNSEKYRELGPSDYLREIIPLFLGRLEAAPPKEDKGFVAAIRELRTLVASYNDFYVLEPLRRMRSKTWAPVTGTDTTRDVWLMTLPEYQREDAQRRIEDFRERWVSFLDDFRDWCEKMRKVFDPNLGAYFERPQKL
ncbi:MAG: hypothetical protein L0387_33455 [Acidobacteria bacterium]|nr:hypothetical protein [Acidobacteriota bacterium]MCI0722650.1 hypothetical protein [Acidobacteriota bacterium]